MNPASYDSGRCVRARHQKFFRRKRNAVGVGVIQQATMVRLWNQTTGSTAGFFMLPAIRR
jgi:hypothetical protein